MQLPTPTPQHEWLHKLVGDWTFEGKGDGGGEGDSNRVEGGCQMKGTESVRSVGGIWVVGEGSMAMPEEMGGGEGKSIITLGYDPVQGKFVGSWVGSMMTHMFVYNGSLDSAGKVLTLDTVGPSFAPDAKPGAMAKYQDIIEIVSDNHRVLRSRLVNDDGSTTPFMEAHYKRV